MRKHLPMRKRPTGLSAGGAFLCAEAWQSGLLHRAYPSADVRASNPLITSREFEPHRFHHQSSGTAMVAPVTAPIMHPGDEPEANDHLANKSNARLTASSARQYGLDISNLPAAMRRIWQVALQARPCTADRTQSSVVVSQNREYFKYL